MGGLTFARRELSISDEMCCTIAPRHRGHFQTLRPTILFRTLRAQLIVGSVTIFVVMLGLLLWNANNLVTTAMLRQFDAEAEQMRPLLNAAISPLLASRDYATLNAVVKESVSRRGLAYLRVVDIEGTQVAAGGSLPASRPASTSACPSR